MAKPYRMTLEDKMQIAIIRQQEAERKAAYKIHKAKLKYEYDTQIALCEKEYTVDMENLKLQKLRIQASGYVPPSAADPCPVGSTIRFSSDSKEMEDAIRQAFAECGDEDDEDILPETSDKGVVHSVKIENSRMADESNINVWDDDVVSNNIVEQDAVKKPVGSCVPWRTPKERKLIAAMGVVAAEMVPFRFEDNQFIAEKDSQQRFVNNAIEQFKSEYPNMADEEILFLCKEYSEVMHPLLADTFGFHFPSPPSTIPDVQQSVRQPASPVPSKSVRYWNSEEERKRVALRCYKVQILDEGEPVDPEQFLAWYKGYSDEEIHRLIRFHKIPVTPV